MTHRPTEYRAMKKILFKHKGVHGNEKIRILNDSLENAHEGLNERDKREIRRSMYKMADKVDGLGRSGALELFAAVGDYLNGMEEG